MTWLLAGCVHTPPHPPLADAPAVRLAAAYAVVDEEGRGCAWEEEALWVGERRIFGNEAPDAPNWCQTPADHWSTVDLLGQDGRFVSVLMENDAGERACVTWDVEAARPATLLDYDEKLAEKRLKIAGRRREKARIGGRLVADNFYVRGGHVVFCLFDEAAVRRDLEVP
ncbi:hypothetical protein LBMAG42_00310 [Deltaproteobacteria bacterium]|nr:hypothetical protein LBMAG42_00310 [Deltaproteobacteria bacterium]